MNVSFSKYSGCGNDFILIDNRVPCFDTSTGVLVRHLCHRRLGIGADGVIFLENATKADFCMRIYNADGSEAEMCGNGLRCLAQFIQELGPPKQQLTIETMHQLLSVTVSSGSVSVKMPAPTALQFIEALQIETVYYPVHFLDTGVPHAVIFVTDLHDENWMSIAPKIRHHKAFGEKGTNVNFAKVESDGDVYVRTYERGVEGETLACGTGAAAVAITAAMAKQLSSPVTVRTKSGDKIEIAFKHPGSPHTSELIMTGPAVKVYSGTFRLPISETFK